MAVCFIFMSEEINDPSPKEILEVQKYIFMFIKTRNKVNNEALVIERGNSPQRLWIGTI